MNLKLRKFIKEAIFLTPMRKYFFPRYSFNFTAPQLCFLCQCLEDTKNIEGAIAEIGCSKGSTTIFLNNYMDAQNIQKKYFAIDTFSGFIKEDIDHEVTQRGKNGAEYIDFQINKKIWFDATMKQNKITRVQSIETDVNHFDLTQLGLLSFVLLDVDLYRPIKKALPELYQALSPNGILVIDDCDSSIKKWDGSDQAYKEFMAEIGKPIQIVHNKLGILRKDA